jgi:uncharacterized protein with FMN-binding domain
MKRHTLYRTIPAMVMTTAVALQAEGTPTTAHATTRPAARSQTFNGPTEDTRHGPIQVSIVVKSKKISNVKASISPQEDGRSPFLQQRAMSVLKQEVLKAQSAKIDTVSGATETSEAYVQSLAAAIKTARKAKALK